MTSLHPAPWTSLPLARSTIHLLALTTFLLQARMKARRPGRWKGRRRAQKTNHLQVHSKPPARTSMHSTTRSAV